MRLQDKVAVITGAGSGIGRATAQRFSEEGAKVVVAEISEERGEETVALLSGEAIFVRTDVGSKPSVEAMFDRTMETFGKLDVLVNNAYGASVQGDGELSDVEEEVWDRIIGVTLKSVYLCSRRAEEGYPIGRIGRPEDIAPLILYLASDESSFTTGGVFVADGGLTAGRRLELTEVARKLGRIDNEQ